MRVVLAVLCLAALAAAQSCGSAAGCALQACGNGRCDYPKEDCNTCPLDCGLCPSCDNVCGNRLCEENEDACSCREDCGVCCQNGVCEAEAGESYANCPVDCSVSLVGAVVDAATNAPIVGAEITVVCRNGDDELPPPPITDNSAFEYLTREAGSYTCTAMADRYLPNSQTITLNANVQPSDPARPRPITIPLQRIHTGVYGTVSSATTGVRIANARVNCTSLSAFVDPLATLREWTNVRGGFHFGQMVVADGAADWLCAVSADGYDESAVQTVVLSQTASTKLEFTLAASQTDLEVRVVDGVTDIAVATPTSVWCKAKTFGAADLPATDVNPATGTVVFTDITPGAYQCSASSDSYHGSCDLVHAHMGDFARVDVVVKPRPGHIRGVTCEDDCVVDPADGSCVNATLAARIEVTCTLDDSENPHQGRTQFNIGSYSSEREDEVGQFTIGNLPAGEYVCVGRFPWKYEDSAPVRAIVRPCEYTDIKLVMPPLLGQIVGLVYVPEQGGAIVPLDGASIVCTDGQLVQHPTTSFPIFYDPSLVSLSVDLVTGYQPNYVIDDANAGSISCTCSADGFDDTTRTGTLIEGGRVRIDCPMRPFLGTVRARLTDAQTEQDVCRGSVQCDGVSRQYSEREPPAGQGPNPFVFSGEFELRIGSYECVGSSIPEYFNSPIGAVEVTGSGEFPVELISQPQPAEIVGRVYDSGIDDPDGVFINSGIENAQVTCDVTKTMGHDAETRDSVEHISGVTPAAGNYGIGGILQFAVWPLNPAECVPDNDSGGQATCVARATGFDVNQQTDLTHRARTTIIDFALQAFIAPITVRHVDELTGLFVTTAGDTFCRRSGDGWRRTEVCNGPCDTASYVFPDKRSDTYTCACSADGYGNAPLITFDHAAPTETVVDCLLPALGHEIDIGVFDVRDRIPTPPFPGANTPLSGPNATVVCSFDDGSASVTPTVSANGIASLELFNFGATMTCTSAFPNYEGERDGMTGDLSNVVTIQIQRDTSSQLSTFLGPIASNLAGVVTDSLNLGRLANVTVSLLLADGSTVLTQVTNANGEYNFAIRDGFGVHMITTVVHVAPPQYEVNTLTVDESVDIQPEQSLQYDFELDPFGSGIDIVVQDSSVAGIPFLENATITCSSADFSTVVVMTNAQGEASIDYTIVAWPFNGGSDFSCTAQYLELGPNVYTNQTLAVNLVRNEREPLLFQIGRLSVQAQIRVSFSVTSGGFSDGRPDVGAGLTFRAFLMPEAGNPSFCFSDCAATNPFQTELIDSIPAPQGRGPLVTNEDSLLIFSVPVQGNVGLLVVDPQNYTGVDAFSWSGDGACPGNCFPYNGYTDLGGDGISYDLDTVDEINRLMTLPGQECFEQGAIAGPDAACGFNPALIPKNLRIYGCVEQHPDNRVQDNSELIGATVELRDASDTVLGSGPTNDTLCYDFTTGATFVNATLIIRVDPAVPTQYTSLTRDIELAGFGILEQVYDQGTVQLRQNNEFTLSGDVVDTVLDPIEGATVRAYIAGGSFTPPTTGDVIAPNDGEPLTVTNATGFWQLDNVWANSANGGTYVCANADGYRASAADGAPAQSCQEFPSLASDLIFDFKLIKDGSIIQVELIRYDASGQRVFLINRQARIFPAGSAEADKGAKRPLNTFNQVQYGGLLNNAFEIECFYQSNTERRVNATSCAGYDIGGAGQRAGNGIAGETNVITACQHEVSAISTQVDMTTTSCIACGCTSQSVFNVGSTDRVFAQCVFCDDQTDNNLEGDCGFALNPDRHGACTDVRNCPNSCHGCLTTVARSDGIPSSCAGFV